jgi:hypothetical protein
MSIPPDEAIVPDEAGDAYVAHATPDRGIRRSRTLLFAGAIAAVIVAVAVIVVVAVVT